MKILVLDAEKTGLPFAMRCLAAKHEVRYWVSPELGSGPSLIGRGMVPRVAEWKPSMRWADLIVMTDNTKYSSDLRPFFRQGFPIMGATEEAAELELDRSVGQLCFEHHGIDILPYAEFTNWDKAIAHVLASKSEFVSKPWGGHSDKNLSYVPNTRADLVARMDRWKKDGLKCSMVLQEKIGDGYEMGVSAWFGPGGFDSNIEEDWEHKKLLVGDLGPTTGEMGTVCRYVKKSKLFEEVLAPLEDELKRRKFVGPVNINCLIDKDGKPWPLEFTCRLGWPATNLELALHKGDPANWMLDLIEGRNTLKASSDICVGAVMAMGDFPWNRDPPGRNDGWPIRGLTPETLPHCYLTSVMMGEGWVNKGTKVVKEEGIVTAGSYVLVVTGTGKTVQEAQASCYEVVDEIKWSPHQTYRTDIGNRLEKCLSDLQDMGYATGMEF